MPYLYVTVGLLVAISINNGFGVVCGMALMASGTLFLVRRTQFRHAFAKCGGYLNVLDWSAPNAPIQGHLQISWRKSFEVGNPVIDAQHRRLFGLCSEIINSVVEQRSGRSTKYLLDLLIEQMTSHFASEEEFFAEALPQLIAEQQRAHHALLLKIKTLNGQLQRNEFITRELVDFVTYEFIVEHLFKEILCFSPEPHRVPKERRVVPREESLVGADSLDAPITLPMGGDSGRMLWSDSVGPIESPVDLSSPRHAG